jgi:hypothetical protein
MDKGVIFETTSIIVVSVINIELIRVIRRGNGLVRIFTYIQSVKRFEED